MAKAKSNPQALTGSFAGYQFDTSSYVTLDLGVARDVRTGQLKIEPPLKGQPKGHKSGKK